MQIFNRTSRHFSASTGCMCVCECVYMNLVHDIIHTIVQLISNTLNTRPLKYTCIHSLFIPVNELDKASL